MPLELDTVLNLYKRKSETPLQTIERYQEKHPEYKTVRMTYAGRLDPMAEGLLLCLSGEKNKEREAYTGLDKDYEFEFMLGMETDTFDILGKITATHKNAASDEVAIAAGLKKYVGTFNQKYPSYSSKVLNGTPLFELARQGKLKDSELPGHDVTVMSLELVSSRTISKTDLYASMSKSISAVTGDFRQAEILKLWDAYFTAAADTFTLYKARVSCGSGFYVRQLVSDLGKDLGTGAVTVSILRTRVGTYKLQDSIK